MESITFTVVPHPHTQKCTLDVLINVYSNDGSTIVRSDKWDIPNDFQVTNVPEENYRTWINYMARAIARTVEDDFEAITHDSASMAPTFSVVHAGNPE